MPRKNTKKLPSFEGVAAGQTATLRMPIGQSYHKILLAYSGVTLAQMLEMRVVINGDVRHRFTTADTYTGLNALDKMNQYMGRAAAAGEIIIDFERFGLDLRELKELTKVGTGVLDDPLLISTFSIEIDIDATAAAPALSARAERSPARVVGDILQTRLFGYNAPAVGEFEISDLPKGDLISKIYFGGHIARAYTRLEVEINGSIIFDKTVSEIELIQNDGIRVPQADFVVYDPSEEGYGDEFLPSNVSDLRFRLTCTNAGAIPVIMETFGSPDR